MYTCTLTNRQQTSRFSSDRCRDFVHVSTSSASFSNPLISIASVAEVAASAAAASVAVAAVRLP